MPIARTATLLLGAAALSILPAIAPDLPGNGLSSDVAYAKNGNSNGNGNGKGLGGFLNNVFGGNGNSKARKSARGGTGNSYRLPKSERATLAKVGVTPNASPLGKPKNFNAKLGRLNSLNRNYRALFNSSAPQLAGIQTYINNSLDYEDGLAGLAGLQDSLDAARELFADQIRGVEPYDDYSYADATAQDLADRLDALNAVDPDTLTDEEAAALEAERAALDEALADDSYADYRDAETAYQDAEDGLSSLAESVSDEALEEALRDMANENRLREYGDDYVDEDMLDYAKRVLGVGDYTGKIDELREAGEAAQTDADPVDDDETADAG